MEIVNIAFLDPSKVCSSSIKTWFEEKSEVVEVVCFVVACLISQINKCLFVDFNNRFVNFVVMKMLNPP